MHSFKMQLDRQPVFDDTLPQSTPAHPTDVISEYTAIEESKRAGERYEHSEPFDVRLFGEVHRVTAVRRDARKRN